MMAPLSCAHATELRTAEEKAEQSDLAPILIAIRRLITSSQQ